ncbi:aspartate/glutamate racemase family protein [Phaeobacter gallaeciensis]|uniref:aspartate/glutamate racemase family protein n=1 Tax=Phaeobacter gallaeciensis TaxID=60890 RepID=UPI00237FD4AA|nr:aspartate/glutamate racemase family protein [Phaeobacter gallaeciensis]MDE4097298.1 aspartate/glutamate racemase family protein [Phaeobacter gallaeciensis]MDE4106188.1 aspartate/glutamate racemase family protein [Phaeobacter gallaeciensis]MDE4110562.1 aspartate/glutamate racemase family protein [Phaeobacter gallaeciensis]MDE4115033.1 aspartate/glutamate racemase family protein [Phaeobacter gallaeciensis]MDE4119502.1 aspartate/glutamate racemase family protein [Phaeobacter gallaeciensis]
MPVIVINPNSTEAMTTSILAAARRTAPDIRFEGWTSVDGPPAIEGPEDGARAVPPLLELVRKASDTGARAIVIACFDDTGLDEARQLATCPVLGIGQASYVMAELIGGPTAVITTVQAAVPVIEANIDAQGHASHIDTIRAANVPVLLLEDSPAEAAAAFTAAAHRLPPDTVNVIIGCAGAVSVTGHLGDLPGLTVIDGVTAAAKLSRALVG